MKRSFERGTTTEEIDTRILKKRESFFINADRIAGTRRWIQLLEAGTLDSLDPWLEEGILDP